MLAYCIDVLFMYIYKKVQVAVLRVDLIFYSNPSMKSFLEFQIDELSSSAVVLK